MKYAKIAALVPAGEHFDESAIVNEGGYLSTAHLAAIEKKMGDDTASIEKHATEVQGLNDQIASANTGKKTAEDSLATANATLATQTTEIASLKAEVAKMKKEPAADPKQTSKKKDESIVTTESGKSKFHTSYDDLAAEYAN